MDYRYKLKNLFLRSKVKMSEVNFSVSYRGSATDSGEIDVKDLASSLFSLGELIDQVNKNINGSKSQIALKIKAFSRGSFVSDLSLLQIIEGATVISACINAQELLNLIFGEFGVLHFWKILKGQQIVDSKETDSGSMNVTLADGSVISNMPKTVFSLFGNVSITNNITNIVAPLNKEGIDEIMVLSQGTEMASIKKQEYFEATMIDSSIEQPEEELGEEELTMFLSFDVIALESKSKRKFMHGDQKIIADVVDQLFLGSVQNQSLSFKSGDFIKARVKIKTTKGPNNTLKATYTVEEVLEFNSIPFQPGLFH